MGGALLPLVALSEFNRVPLKDFGGTVETITFLGSETP
jgi:hypothetical protein